MFYPPINTAINVFFALITGDVVIAMKLFTFVTFLLSGIFMYQFVDTISKNKLAALFSSIFYMIAPYRMLNTYVRLAVGEMTGFIFIPLIFRGIYYIFEEKKEKSYLYVFGTIGLLLSHNITTMLTFLLGLAYLIMNICKLKDK